MIESWLRAAERIEHLATVSGAKTIGLISIGGDAGVSTLSQMLCRLLSGGKAKALLVNLTKPVQHAAPATKESATGGFVWDRTKAGNDGCAAIEARPTTGTRFLYNDVSLLQEAWRNELGTYSKLIVDLPPVFHGQNDLLSPLAAAATCDAVFLVCMRGRTMRWQLAEAVALLRASRVPLVGIVVNARDYPGAVREIDADWTPVTAEEGPPGRSAVQNFVQAAWRRRYLVVVPILVMLPLSVVAAKLLPVTYAATSLLLLQEPGVEGKSGTTFAVSERIEERVAGLEALLKSSRVLSPALANLRKAGLARQEPKGSIRDLRDRLSMKLLGLDVLQINLKGDTQYGLGDQLKEVVTRFLESLTTDQGALTAGELLVQDRRAAWQTAEQAYAEASAKRSEISPASLESSSGRLAALKASLETKRAELAATDAEMIRASRQPQDPGPSPEMAARKDQLVKEVAQLETESRGLNGLVEANRGRESELLKFQAEVASTQRQYATLAEKYDRDSAEHQQRLLDAPERIRIIDPPSDPEAPETSRLLYVLFGMAASVVLGVGLAWGAEQTDPSLRDRHEFSAVAGVPVVAHLRRFASSE